MTAVEATFGERDLGPHGPGFVTPRLRVVAPVRRGLPPRRVLAGVSLATACAALLPGPTFAQRLSVGSVALAVTLAAFGACKNARRYVIAWRTETWLRAVAGGVAVAAAVGATATAAGAGLSARHLLAVVLVTVAVLAFRLTPRPEVELDLRDGVVVGASRVTTLPPLCRAAKRSIDLAVALFVGLLVVPVVAALALVISLGSPGGWLFRQTRVGQNGRRFTLMKLRTMKAANDDSQHKAYVAALIANNERAADGELFKITDDPRITPAGRWIRKLSLDELPQLLNVLRGDMSLVGPRPPLPSETELYDERARLRLRSKPGMTGLWQVSGRSRVGFDEMIEMDIAYWQNWSLRMELGILARTARAVFAADTA